MNYTDRWAIPFPGGEDTGASALYLQHLAERAEAALSEPYGDIYHEFTHGYPILIYNNGAIYTHASELVSTAEGDFANGDVPCHTVVYTNTSEPQPTSGGSIYLYRPGLWLIGANLTAQAVGAVNTNTYRMGRVASTHYLLNFENRVTQKIEDWQPSANVGGESVLVQGQVFIPSSALLQEPMLGAPPAYASVRGQFYHGNTSSNMQINVGNARIWAVWIGYDAYVGEGV